MCKDWSCRAMPYVTVSSPALLQIISCSCHFSCSIVPATVHLMSWMLVASLCFSVLPNLLISAWPGECQTFQFALLNLLRIPWAHVLSLSRFLWMISHPSGMSAPPLSLVLSAGLLQWGTLNPSVNVIDEDIEDWSQYRLLRDTTHCWCPLGLWAVDHYLHSPSSPPMKSTSLQFREEEYCQRPYSSPETWCL